MFLDSNGIDGDGVRERIEVGVKVEVLRLVEVWGWVCEGRIGVKGDMGKEHEDEMSMTTAWDDGDVFLEFVDLCVEGECRMEDLVLEVGGRGEISLECVQCIIVHVYKSMHLAI